MRLLVLTALAVVLVLAAAVVPLRSAALTRPGADYGLYCLQGRLIVDRRDIEELKNRYRSDVCRLDQDPCASGILEKLRRLGGPGAACDCQ